MKTFFFFAGLTLLMVIIGNLEQHEWEQDQKLKSENRRNLLDKLSQNL
jgi:hypothetical protein